MERLSRLVLARRGCTLTIIAVLFVLGGAAIALLLPRLSERNEYPDLPGYQANQKIRELVGTGGYERPVVPVVTLPAGTTVDDPAGRDAVGAAFAAAAATTGSRAVSYADTSDPALRSADGRVSTGLLFGPPVEQGGIPGSALGEGAGLETVAADAMRPFLPPGSTVQVTGLDALATGGDAGGLNMPVKLVVTVLAALAVLIWVFRSRLALVPLGMAVVAIPVAFVGLLAVSPFVTIHETTVMMLPLLGVGIAIDYALILVTRWREERGRGLPGEPAEEAVHRAMATAGHAVVFSAVAVAIGLATMLVLPIPLLRSLGVGGMAVTAASALVALTVLPLVLARLGRHAGTDHREQRASRAWTSWARWVVRHRILATTLACGALAGLSLIGTGINLNVPVTANLADSGPGRDGLTTLQETGVATGTVTAFDVYVPPGPAPDQVARELARVPGVATVLAPDGPAWRTPEGSVVTVVPIDEGGTAAGRDTVHRVVAAAPDGVLVGGNVTQQIDYVDAVRRSFPVLLALVALVTLVVLARAFGSLLLAVKAIVLNLLSLGAVLGAMVVLWQWGWGTEALLGIQPDGAIGTFVPATIFAFLYGLTMDYEVFILSRIREAYDRTGSTVDAVVEGIGRTGTLVTSAALILFFAFASMAGGGELDVAIFASGVALGILIDATLVRAVLVPATVALLGRWNWWLPRWAGQRRELSADPR
ncbi:MMPL family transporter [Pseudonocardia sichuanensis]